MELKETCDEGAQLERRPPHVDDPGPHTLAQYRTTARDIGPLHTLAKYHTHTHTRSERESKERGRGEGRPRVAVEEALDVGVVGEVLGVEDDDRRLQQRLR
eukprot:2325012-Rhodomonas_salina.1